MQPEKLPQLGESSPNNRHRRHLHQERVAMETM